MAYIYQIVNDINQKIYVGKTEFSIEKRFKEHCKDAYNERYKNRPLYSAMRKYGIENFHIELIEETNSPEEREVYWIEQKRSFKNGYNATIGGDGKKYIDYDLVIKTYNQCLSMIETAKCLNIHEDTVSLILHTNGIPTLSGSEVSRIKYGNIINQYDLKMNYIQTFPSIKSAAIFLKGKNMNHGVAAHISDVCKGKRKTAYGYIWRYADK